MLSDKSLLFNIMANYKDKTPTPPGKVEKPIIEYTQCPYCQSRKVFKLRIDSDWGMGTGEYYPVNTNRENEDVEGFYTDEEMNYDATDRPDIDVFHCLSCDKIFDL